MDTLWERWGRDAAVLVVMPALATGDGNEAAVADLERAIATASWFEQRESKRLDPPLAWRREGSAVLAVFASPVSALEEALAASSVRTEGPHRHALFACGVGAGPTIVGDGCDVHGPPARRARRLATLAAPGDLWVDDRLADSVPLPAGVGRHPGNPHLQRLAGCGFHEVRDYR